MNWKNEQNYQKLFNRSILTFYNLRNLMEMTTMKAAPKFKASELVVLNKKGRKKFKNDPAWGKENLLNSVFILMNESIPLFQNRSKIKGNEHFYLINYKLYSYIVHEKYLKRFDTPDYCVGDTVRFMYCSDYQMSEKQKLYVKDNWSDPSSVIKYEFKVLGFEYDSVLKSSVIVSCNEIPGTLKGNVKWFLYSPPCEYNAYEEDEDEDEDDIVTVEKIPTRFRDLGYLVSFVTEFTRSLPEPDMIFLKISDDLAIRIEDSIDVKSNTLRLQNFTDPRLPLCYVHGFKKDKKVFPVNE